MPPPAETTFASLAGQVDQRFVQAITDHMHYTTMTDVQALTLPHLLQGKDILAQAKTGTGKTIAFLLPSLQRIITSSTSNTSSPIRTLILSPTRELASQIAEECERLTKLVPTLRTATAVGGNNKQKEENSIARSPPSVLVATPGRMLDHLQDEHMRSLLSGLQTLILDEADRLLDQGFKKEIDAILRLLPDKQRVPRQTMLFSATIPESVKEIARKTLNANYTFVTTVSAEEANSHERIPQHLITLPDERPSTLLPTAIALILSELAHDPSRFKAIVFLPTARQTGLYAAIFRALSSEHNLPEILEIHSRKSQPQRTKAADAFSVANAALLFSSDVTARGLDFPNVTTVIQIGLPMSGEQYIHRLGRTGRAGASGQGFTILYPFEERVFRWFKELKPLPIKPYTTLAVTQEHEAMAKRAVERTNQEERCTAYSAWLGFYKGFAGRFGWSSEDLVRWANEMATVAWGLEEVPGLEAKTVGKMQLKGVRGLNIIRGPGKSGRGGRGGRSGGRTEIREQPSSRVDSFGQEMMDESMPNANTVDSVGSYTDGSHSRGRKQRRGGGRGESTSGGMGSSRREIYDWGIPDSDSKDSPLTPAENRNEGAGRRGRKPRWRGGRGGGGRGGRGRGMAT